MAQCKLCGEILEPCDFEAHLWEYHCLTYRDYYEVIMNMIEPEVCWRCGTVKYPLAYIHSDFPGIPCWGCIKKKTQVEAIRKQVFETLKELQEDIIKNKYYRHLICWPKDLSASVSHNLPETAGILDLIAKQGGLRPGKRGEEIFTLKTENLACPYELSYENLGSMYMELKPISCEESEPGVWEIIIGNHVYHVELPKVISYDGKFFPKHNIFSSTSKKRNQLRFGKTDKVYVFREVFEDHTDIRSIFKVQEKVREEDASALCDVLLSNKVFSDIIIEIYNELVQYLVGIYDRALFKNYIRFNQPGVSGLEIEFSWYQKETSKNILTILIWS